MEGNATENGKLQGGKAKTETSPKLTKEALQVVLKDCEIPHTGKKDDLVKRVQENAHSSPVSPKKDKLVKFMREYGIDDETPSVDVSESYDKNSLGTLKNNDLKAILKENSLPTSGKKADLLQRLQAAGVGSAESTGSHKASAKVGGRNERSEKPSIEFGVLCTSQTFLGSHRDGQASHFSLHGLKESPKDDSGGGKASSSNVASAALERSTPPRQPAASDKKAQVDSPAPVPCWLCINRCESTDPLGPLYRQLYEW
ncbi:expressed unknown protein [Seminavis robusta]|uniref:SAP domain-containing protein n=1 Tax=Seminavis robusta TaxID=568900 RepID=A0A9N8HGN2_9STRA|nr:expressed unknown protein [Seminavis robusta]CAB9530047.1 expressed unknown protein [Seminavis robusta]|eukprot:Sro2722_g335550.1 n/a (257) ;mRNA; r:1547-2317